MTEKPDTVHGRLMEAVHVSGYTMERALAELEWLLSDGRWQQVAGGFDDINAFLATIDLGDFRLLADRRKSLVKKLTAIEASQRATARALGVDKRTVARDLGAGASAPSGLVTPLGINAETDDTGAGAPPDTEQWFQGDTDPADLAKQRTKREEKERERQAMRDANAELVANTEPLPASEYPTIVIDPPWDWGDEGDQDQLGRARPKYATLPLQELLALPIPDLSTENSHIYLWVTNRSLPKGFMLLAGWGFRYITALTWTKPHFGMGNYFRGQTEHVLFGVKGSLPLLRRDVGTVFEDTRGSSKHSSKPAAFYEIVESCSPGPWLELFLRGSPRPGWTGWGAEKEASGIYVD